jgi:hypothetical protein
MEEGTQNLKEKFSTIEHKLIQKIENKKIFEQKKYKDALGLLKKINKMMETEVTMRIEQERFFINLIDKRAKQILNKYVTMYITNLNQMQSKIDEMESRCNKILDKSQQIKIEVETIVDGNKEKFKNENREFRQIMERREQKQIDDHTKDIEYINSLKLNYNKMKQDFETNRDNAHKK